MTFQVGDRVKYTGNFTSDLYGELGTVVEVVDHDDIAVAWDTEKALSVGIQNVLDESISLIPRPDTKPTPMEIVDDYKQSSVKVGKIKSDGGPASYYDFLPDWQTLNDYIEYKSEDQWGADSFHLANITKAGCRWGDKDGTTKTYDAKKIVYSALRILRRLSGKAEVQKFLKELMDDPQFKD